VRVISPIWNAIRVYVAVLRASQSMLAHSCWVATICKFSWVRLLNFVLVIQPSLIVDWASSQVKISARITWSLFTKVKSSTKIHSLLGNLFHATIISIHLLSKMERSTLNT
jgi:hypothetical protein